MLLTRSGLGRSGLFGGLAVTLLLATTRVSAAPARVTVFEGKVFASKDASGAVVHTFAEDTRVSVSETVEDGWRQVRLPTGATGWIRSSEVQLVAVPAEAPKPTSELPAPTAATSLAARPPEIYVKDLRHLAELTAADREVQPMARKLVSAERSAAAIFLGGTIAGGVLTVLSLTAFTVRDCMDETVYSDDFKEQFTKTSCRDAPNIALAVAGLGIAIGGMIIGAVALPSRNDLLDVLNAWNQRHPDQPFTFR